MNLYTLFWIVSAFTLYEKLYMCFIHRNQTVVLGNVQSVEWFRRLVVQFLVKSEHPADVEDIVPDLNTSAIMCYKWDTFRSFLCLTYRFILHIYYFIMFKQIIFVVGILTGVSLCIAGSVLKRRIRGGDLEVLVYIGMCDCTMKYN